MDAHAYTQADHRDNRKNRYRGYRRETAWNLYNDVERNSKVAANFTPFECAHNSLAVGESTQSAAQEHSKLRVLLFGTIIWKIAIDCGLHNLVQQWEVHIA